MSATLEYREWLPPPELAGVVRCVWGLWGGGGGSPEPGDVQPIVPDGCSEVILNLADPFQQLLPTGEARVQPTAMFVGQTTGPALVGPTGATRIVGIRLVPWGGGAVLSAPPAELRDTYLPLTDVLPAHLLDLQAHLAGLPPSTWGNAVFDHLNRAAFGIRSAGGGPWLAMAIVREIRAVSGRVTVGGLARRFGVTERSVERVLRDQVGLPPLVLARILRMQDALGRMLARPDTPLGQVAASSGFYDQAHFSREFRRLVGCSPSDFLGGERELTEHFVQEE